MKAATVCAIFVLLAFALACGGGSMNTGGGGTGPTPESVVVSKTVASPFNLAMSTSFQPAEWDYQFFTLNPSATTTLGNLNPQHIRLQAVSQGVPQGSEGTSSTTWDFSMVDAITQPVLNVADHSPEFQIAKAPPFMFENNNSGNSFNDLTFTQFAGYTQNLVEYYNTGGFTANGQTYLSASYPTYKITWWGIYNEPNINNNLTPQQYTDMYNAVVPAMQATDSSLSSPRSNLRISAARCKPGCRLSQATSPPTWMCWPRTSIPRATRKTPIRRSFRPFRDLLPM